MMTVVTVETEDGAKIELDIKAKIISTPPDVPNFDPKLPDDFWEDQWYKGANMDATLWKAVSMKDDPLLWKVVDDRNINVAHRFSTQTNANLYIQYYIWKQSQVPFPPPPTDGGEVDQFGIRKIFPSKPGGLVVTECSIEHKTRNYRSGKPSEPTVELEMQMPVGHRDDLECTSIVTMIGMQHNDTIDWKVRGPPHSKGSGKKWYCIDQETDGGHGTTLKTEGPHPTYYNNTKHTKNYFSPPLLANAIFGWKGIVVNKSPTDVYLAAWINMTPRDESGWKKVWDVHDTGQIDHGQITPATGGNIQIRIDGIPKGKKVGFEKTSAREISYSELSALLE